MFQAIFNGALSHGETGRFCRRVRRWILKWSDPMVQWELNGRKLRLNLSHQLPLYRREFPTYSANLERLAGVIRELMGHLTWIDVGANIGDSIALMGWSSGDAALLIEGDPHYFRLLQANTADLADAVCVCAMLSDAAGEAELQLVSTEGTGKVIANPSGGARVNMQTLHGLVEQQPKFRAASLLKIDVDGYDFRVLRGALPLIQLNHPILFFEQDPALLEGAGEDPNQVWAWLLESGYDWAILYDNVGFRVGVFPLADVHSLEQLNGYARQQPGYYYDVVAFAPQHALVRDTFADRERRVGDRPGPL